MFRRHHVLESGLQKAVKTAVDRAGITKRISTHIFRHYAELKIMPSWHVCITPMFLFSLPLFIHPPSDYSA